jgi:adenylate cyclase
VNIRKVTAGVLIGLGAAAIVLLLAAAGALEKAELIAYDWRIRSAANPSTLRDDIVIVEVNDTSIRDMAPIVGRWPWPRVVFAALLSYLNRAPARVVAFDFGFIEPDRTRSIQIGTVTLSGEESDAALAEALSASPATVLLAYAVYEGVEGKVGTAPTDWFPRSWPFRLGPAIEERPFIDPPRPEFTAAATLLGHNFLPFDIDGPARRMPPFIRQGDHFMPSLGIGAALVAGGFRPEEVVLEGETIRVRERRIPLVPFTVYDAAGKPRPAPQLTTLINYQAPPLINGARPYKTYEAREIFSAIEQLEAGQPPKLDPAVFKDKIVFVGLTTTGLMDAFTTPFGADMGNMPGIQLHATMADNLLSNRFIRPASFRSRIATVIAAGLLVGLLAALLAFAPAAAGTVLAAAGWTWFSLASFKGGVWLNMAQPLMTMGLALFAGTAYQYFVEGAEKRVVKKLFGRYVSRDVYQQLLDNPNLAELGGRRREMTVLFSDIRGFTAMTEKGHAEALVAQLNEYFSTMVEVVFRHHGTVDKFVGDMVMALFSAPVEDADHAEHALAAAVDMVSELAKLNRKWLAAGKVQLDIGIGINSGEMIAGNIGSERIMSYTVIGDNVNLGSRLESLNKEFQSRIIISDATRMKLRTERTLRPLGEVTVKGKTRPVSIFEVVVPSPLVEASQAPEERQS